MNENPEQQVPAILLSYDQAARALALSKSKLYTLVNLGEIPTVRIGGSTRFRPADLQAYVDRHITYGQKKRS